MQMCLLECMKATVPMYQYVVIESKYVAFFGINYFAKDTQCFFSWGHCVDAIQTAAVLLLECAWFNAPTHPISRPLDTDTHFVHTAGLVVGDAIEGVATAAVSWRRASPLPMAGLLIVIAP